MYAHTYLVKNFVSKHITNDHNIIKAVTELLNSIVLLTQN